MRNAGISYDKVEFKVYELDRRRDNDDPLTAQLLAYAACFIIIWPAFFYNPTNVMCALTRLAAGLLTWHDAEDCLL